MTRIGCGICANKTIRDRVDALLVEGKSVREIGREVSIPKSTVYVHRVGCFMKAVSEAVEESGRNRGEELLGKLDGLLAEAMSVVRRAKAQKHDKTLLSALREARDIIRTIGEFSGARPEPPARLSYTIVFEGGRPVARKDTIELSVPDPPVSSDAMESNPPALTDGH